MAAYTGINVGGSSPTEIVDALIALNRSLEYQMNHLDSENILEVGGWRVGPTSIASKDMDVGMSTDDSLSENIRFWAGNSVSGSAPFRVYDSGRVVANDITMAGGDIIWGDVEAPDYNLIVGDKPPSDANNTYSELLYNTGIRGFVNVSGTLFISADYIKTGTLSADFIDGGTITGVSINVSTDLQVGDNITLGSDNFQKAIYFGSTGFGMYTNGTTSLAFAGPTGSKIQFGPDVEFLGDVLGTGLVATFG